MTSFRERAVREMEAEHPAATVTPIMRKLVADSAAMLARGPADARQRAAAARAHAIANLEALHAETRRTLDRRGIGYHRAADAAEAVATVQRLLGNARRVAKSKTMVGEEVGLTHALRAAGIDVLETDIGEYIVDLEGRGPSHITAPALHLRRDRIREILARSGADLPDDDPVRLSRHVRDAVGAFFRDCDAAITGANTVIASSGRIVVVENEGNVALGVSHPKLHIVITGLEKVVANEAAALAVLEVLASSATGQPLTAFTHFLAEPARGQERHIVFVDNGRSRVLADPAFRELLRCIRCGACMNACPVYRTAGGLSYGTPYMGPIGAVLAPLLWPQGSFGDLPGASTLCGRCREVCPVGIPLDRMLASLRHREAEQAGSWAEKTAWQAWAAAFSHPGAARAATALGRFGLAHFAGLLERRRPPGDPRRAPSLEPERDPTRLAGGPPIDTTTPPTEPLALPPPSGRAATVALFRERAAEAGVELPAKVKREDGDLRLKANAAIASTGSVLLTGEAAARRPLLAARRVVVEVREKSVVPYPSDLEPFLGKGDALILTGASRTADIEKQIVRGIHGAERLAVTM